MISFNNLGNYGRLGNQMFQYASLRGIASNRGFDFCIPPENVFGVNDSNVKNFPTNIHNTFNISWVKTDLPNNKIIQENGFEFNEYLFNECEDNVDLLGYFQSEKYFKHIEKDIRSDFSFSQDLVNDCSEFINTVSSNREVISIHVRRGDYLNLQSFHPTPPVEYYSESLKKFPNLPVLIFSDDVEWCLNQHLFDDDRFLVSQQNPADFDLCLMSMCSHHIIANSSFSWWGAWLSNSKNVIAPKTWFGPSLLHFNIKDLYVNTWELI
jgi:hypothetical protein